MWRELAYVAFFLFFWFTMCYCGLPRKRKADDDDDVVAAVPWFSARRVQSNDTGAILAQLRALIDGGDNGRDVCQGMTLARVTTQQASKLLVYAVANGTTECVRRVSTHAAVNITFDNHAALRTAVDARDKQVTAMLLKLYDADVPLLARARRLVQ